MTVAVDALACDLGKFAFAGVWMDLSGNQTNPLYEKLQPYVDMSKGPVSVNSPLHVAQVHAAPAGYFVAGNTLYGVHSAHVHHGREHVSDIHINLCCACRTASQSRTTSCSTSPTCSLPTSHTSPTGTSPPKPLPVGFCKHALYCRCLPQRLTVCIKLLSDPR